jgi:hypothetical protein
MISIVLDIQQNLNAPKNLYNKFGGYSYRSCESILVALKPLLAKHKAIIYFNEKTVEQNGWHYIEATACLRAEGKEEVFTTTGYAREDESRKGMDASQITGSASSYARKYALNAMFAIDDVKDSDATNTHGKEDKEPAPNATNNGKEDKEPAPTSAPSLEEFEKKIKTLITFAQLQIYWNTLSSEVRESEEYKKIINSRYEEIKKPKNTTK